LSRSSPAPSTNVRRSTIANRASTSGTRNGLATLASLARDKTSSTLATLAKPRHSTYSAPYSSYSSHHLGSAPTPASTDNLNRHGSAGPQSNSGNPDARDGVTGTAPTSSLPTDTIHTVQTLKQDIQHRAIPRSQPPSTVVPDGGTTDQRSLKLVPRASRSHTPRAHSRSTSAGNSRSASPVPSTVSSANGYNKMHQTSSRLLRMTEEERPFTRVSAMSPFSSCMMDRYCHPGDRTDLT
jgi:hypothetical protein